MPSTPRLLIFAPNLRSGDHAGHHGLLLPRRAYRVVVPETNLCGYRDQPVHVVDRERLPYRLAEELTRGLLAGAFRIATVTDIANVRDAHAENATSS
jgi:hypothetical protein